MAKKHLMKLVALIQGFCYVYPVHFMLSDGSRQILSIKGSAETREYAIKKHGSSYLEVEDSFFHLLLFPLCMDKTQTIILDKRIVSCCRLTNIINGLFKTHFDHLPTFIMLLMDEADVNMAVDKSEIILRSIKMIETKLAFEMDVYFSKKMFIHGISSQETSLSSSAGAESFLSAIATSNIATSKSEGDGQISLRGPML